MLHALNAFLPQSYSGVPNRVFMLHIHVVCVCNLTLSAVGVIAVL